MGGLTPDREPSNRTPAAIRVADMADGDIEAEDIERPGKPNEHAFRKIERSNQECARRGFGVWLYVINRQHTTEFVFMPYVWSKQNKTNFDASPGTLPVAFAAADISMDMPMLMVRTAVGVDSSGDNDGPIYVAVSGIEKKTRLPGLVLVVLVSKHTQEHSRSHLLIPDEYIDYDLIWKDLSTDAGCAVSSAREYRSSPMGRGDESSRTMRYRSQLDLQSYIKKPASLQDFMVHEGTDEHDGVYQFWDAHNDMGKEKLVPWYGHGTLYATGHYIMNFGTLLQTLGNDVLAGMEVDEDDDENEEDEEEEAVPPPKADLGGEFDGAMDKLDGTSDYSHGIGGLPNEVDEEFMGPIDWRDHLCPKRMPGDFEDDAEYDFGEDGGEEPDPERKPGNVEQGSGEGDGEEFPGYEAYED